MFAVLVRNDGGSYVSVILAQQWGKANEVGQRHRADGRQVIVRRATSQDVASYEARKRGLKDAHVEALMGCLS